MSVRTVANGLFRPLQPIRSALALSVALVVGLASTGRAAELGARVYFDEVDVHLAGVGANATHVSMDGLLSVGGAGVPELPMEVQVFRVPDGFVVSNVRAVPAEEIRIAQGVRLGFREAAADESDPAAVRRAFPTGAIEPGSRVFPAHGAVLLGDGDMAGYRLSSVAVFPVRWDEATGDLYLATSMDLELDLMPVARASGLVRERRNPEAEVAYAQAVQSLVANPWDVVVPSGDSEARAAASGGFAPSDLPSPEGSPVDMVIVTTTALAPDFQVLADWKTKKGVPTVVRTTDWIEANYTGGHDRAERMRLFLQDAYSRWGTYLLLVGGDYDKVPPRLAHNRFFFGGTDIPTDQYFACLNGDWNGDGDELYGEGLYQGTNDDGVDLYPELFVGRASVDNAAEVQVFVAKSFAYEKTPPAGYVKKVCYLAEVLFPSTWEFGDPPESITLDGANITEDFDTKIPLGWTRTKAYQVANTLSRATALTQLSSGHHHLMTLMNHGDAFKFSAGNGLNPLIYTADTDTLTNGNYLMFVMATACNPNQIDLECQGESLMNNPNGGAVAVMGPTREDFPLSAAAYHKAMLDAIFTSGITRLGVFSQVHRIPFVALSQTDHTPDRWTMLTKELLGDPDLRFWTEEPQLLTVAHSASVPLGTSSLTVTVTDPLASPVADALVCVSDGTGTYARGRTNGAGQVTLPLASSATGTANVVASAKEFKPRETTVTIGAVGGAQLALSGSAIDDDLSGNSVGNGDGVIDAGETIELEVTLRNGGGATANGVNVTASVEPGAAVTADLLYGGVRDPLKVFIGPDGVHPGAIPFTLNFAAPAIEYIGTPLMSFGPDSTSSDRGIFLWQDLEGWHLQWSSGADSIQITGTISTDGRVRGATSLSMESVTDSYAVTAGEDSLVIAGTTHRSDIWDGVDFALADNTMIAITTANANLGNIAAAASASGKVAFSVSATARPNQIAYVDLQTASTLRATLSSEVAVAMAGPEVEAFVFSVQDGVSPPVSGDGDGIIEVGETVRLTPTVLNRGNGYAASLDGAATAGAGISFVDAVDSYGDLAVGAQSSGTNGYVFSVLNGTGTSITLTLTDSLGRTRVKTIDFVAPGPPANITFASTSSTIVPYWDPNAEADLAGYNVYRSATQGSGHTRQNADLIRTGSRYEDSGLALGSSFYYYATAVDSSGNEGPASSEAYGYTTQVQVPGWPQSANSNVFSAIAIADADGIGGDELYVGSQDFKFYGWDANGSIRAGFPITTLAAIWGTPALADLDKDGDLEILFGSNDARFYVVHHDGTPMFGANPYILDLPFTGQLFRGTPSVADVDGDGELEFFVGTDAGTVYGFNHDGTGILNPSGLFYGPIGNGSVSGPLIWGSIAIADWDNDGDRELAFASWNDSLYVVNPNGTNVAGFPKGHGKQHKGGPVFADLDNDGTMEVIVGNSNHNLYAYDHDGSGYLAGNPVFATLPDEIIAMPTPCQLDGDPELELVVTCLNGDVYAFNHDGSGFLQAGGLFAAINEPTGDDKISASAIVVDVDGDSDFEIFVGHRNHFFYGFHSDGSTVVGMPIPTGETIYSTAAAGDIDHDGDVDIAFASYDQFVNVLDFPGASTPAAYQWPTYAGSNSRRAVYGEPGPAATGVTPVLGPVTFRFGLSQNSPNPFGSATSIRYSVPRDMPVTLRIFNVEGRLIRTLVNGHVPAGPGAAEWDGRDSQGSRLSSGVYFYRLQGGDDAVTRKGILLR